MILPREIMKIKKRHIDYISELPCLNYVMSQRFINKPYHFVQLGSSIYKASIMSGIVWIEMKADFSYLTNKNKTQFHPVYVK